MKASPFNRPAGAQALSDSRSALARHGVCLALAFVVAAGLFLLMLGMISRGEVEPGLQQRLRLPEFVRMSQLDEPVSERRRQVPKVQENIEPLPMMEAVSSPRPPTPQTPAIDPDLPNIRPDLALAGLPMAAPMVPPTVDNGPVRYTQSLIPVSQIPPRYPRRAQLDGLSGWVRLEFIVNPDGSVRDVTVVEAEPDKGIFDHEAVRALSRWRFQPQIRDGEAVPALATIVINFNLQE